MATDTMDVSVILATRNRSTSLARLLEGLARQHTPPEWELVVCDNGSTDATAELLRRYGSRLRMTCLYESQPGKSRALNEAMRNARGDLLVFTDDDVLPDPDWLAGFHRAGKKYPDTNVFGGRIMVDESILPPWLIRCPRLHGLLVSAHDRGDMPRYYSFNDYPFGPNMAVRRHALRNGQVVWPEHIGPGTSIPVGDERWFLHRLSAPQDSDRVYLPDVRVRHYIEYEQIEFAGAVRRYYTLGKSDQVFERYIRQETGASPLQIKPLLTHLSASAHPYEFFCVLARLMGRYL